MSNTLYLKKQGIDFYREEEYNISDIGNYRVCTDGKSIITKDRTRIMLTFKMFSDTFIMNTQYTGIYSETEDGIPIYGELRNLVMEDDIIRRHLPYTKEGILKAVNLISKNSYDKIEII